MEENWIVKLERISKERQDICNICPSRKSYNEDTKIWDKTILDDACGICGCPLKAKISANIDSFKDKEKTCPLEKW